MDNNIDDKTMINEETETHPQIDGNNKSFCPQCGFTLDGQNYCPVCGCKITNNVTMNIAGNAENKKSQDKKVVIMLGVLIALLVVICAYFFINNTIMPSIYYNIGVEALEDDNYDKAIAYFQKANGYKDSKNKIENAEEMKEIVAANEAFEKQKDKMSSAYKLCTSSGTKLSYDGLSITVDSSSKYDKEGVADIVMVIYALGLPESLVDEMSSTNALMGRQTRTYNGIEVSWSYHPDNGLDAIFKIIE